MDNKKTDQYYIDKIITDLTFIRTHTDEPVKNRKLEEDEILVDLARRVGLGGLLERLQRSGFVTGLGLSDTEVVVYAGVVELLRSDGQDGNLLLGAVGQRLGSVEVLLDGQVLTVLEAAMISASVLP